MSPVVSIITVVFNAKEDFKLTLESVKRQSYPDIEYNVVDGGSTDGTLEAIQVNEKYISKWVSEPDKGIYDAMNKGMEMATGDWLLFLNAGDVFTSTEILETLDRKDFFEDASIVYGAFDVPTSTNKITLKAKPLTKLNLLIWGNRTVCHQAILVRRLKMVKYELKFPIKGDLDWYFRLLKEMNSLEIKRTNLSIVDYQRGGISDQVIWKSLVEHLNVLYVHTGIGFLLSIPVLLYSLILFWYQKLFTYGRQ